MRNLQRGTSQVRRISLKEREEGVLKDDELARRLRDHALFVGLAPVEKPRYAVSVLVDALANITAVAHVTGKRPLSGVFMQMHGKFSLFVELCGAEVTAVRFFAAVLTVVSRQVVRA